MEAGSVSVAAVVPVALPLPPLTTSAAVDVGAKPPVKKDGPAAGGGAGASEGTETGGGVGAGPVRVLIAMKDAGLVRTGTGV